MASVLPIQQCEVGTRYHLMAMLGEGAYGVVCSAWDREEKNMVAIKKVKIGNNATLALRTLREIKIVKHLTNTHRNIVRLISLLKPISAETMYDVYFVFEKMDSDLHRVIRLQILSNEHVRYFTFQLLSAIDFLHSNNIIHRDLKPSNLLINSNCDLKLADFGLARTEAKDSTVKLSPLESSDSTSQITIKRRMTEYIATRWYRAPEIIFSCGKYDKSIDMWAVGCIIMEMIVRRPLFPGNSHYHQLMLINNLLGPLSQTELSLISSPKIQEMLVASTEKTTWANVLDEVPGYYDVNAIDLVKKLLQFLPENRLSSYDALCHPYLDMYACDMMPAKVLSHLDMSTIDTRRHEMTPEELKQKIWDEI